MDQGRRVCIEPRNRYSRGHKDKSAKAEESRPFRVCGKAAILKAIRQVFRIPPGSETRSCSQRGSSGTREIRSVSLCSMQKVLGADS